MNTFHPPVSKLGNSNGGRQHGAPTKPGAARMSSPAPGRNSGQSFNKGGLGESLAEEDDESYQQSKPKPSQTQATYGGVAASSPKKPADFQTLLQRCFDGASRVKGSEAENTKVITKLLVNIYRLSKILAANPDAKQAINKELQKAGIRISKKTGEYTPLSKLFLGKDYPRSTISRLASTMQYAKVNRVKSQGFADFVQDEGGTAECARKMAEVRKAAAGTSEDAESAAMKLIAERLADAPKYNAPKKMQPFKKGFGALLIKVELDGRFSIIGHRPASARAVRSFRQLKAKTVRLPMKKRL